MRRLDRDSAHNAVMAVMAGAGAVALVACLSAVPVMAQGRQGAAGPPPAPRAASPIDLTGYWVSVVTEDWRYRMVTPAKGDFQSVPMTAAAREVANRWDPARDEAEGVQCKSYGAPAIMRIPGRLHITWQDDSTLKIETDAGTQTRLLQFGSAEAETPRSCRAARALNGWSRRRLAAAVRRCRAAGR